MYTITLILKGGSRPDIALYQSAEQTALDTIRFVLQSTGDKVEEKNPADTKNVPANEDKDKKDEDGCHCLIWIVEYFISKISEYSDTIMMQQKGENANTKGSSKTNSNTEAMSPTSSYSNSPSPLGYLYPDTDVSHLIFVLKTAQLVIMGWGSSHVPRELYVKYPKLGLLLVDDLCHSLLMLCSKRGRVTLTLNPNPKP